MTTQSFFVRAGVVLLLALMNLAPVRSVAGSAPLEVGLAVLDITPEVPIRLAGYASRNRPADKVDHPLLVQALAMRHAGGEPFVFVSLDNCEVSQAFMEPVLREYAAKFQLARGAVAVVSSHTHSAPVLEDTLTEMAQPSPAERAQIGQYSRMLKAKLVEVVGAALSDLQPARLETSTARATFAMNRRSYAGDRVVFGDNPDGPVDWDVPVLRITGDNGAVRAIVFGYACHGTTVRSGDDWYAVSGEYMAYAREQIEAVHPGAVAIYLTGMGADSDPAPRGPLIRAKGHGLELAGAVVGALNHPMRPVRGELKFAYEEIQLPLATPPSREQLEKDAQSQDVHVKFRAERYLKLLQSSQGLPESVRLPIAAVRIGDDLTFILMGGEVVVDYARRFKRVLAQDHPWPIGYAYDVPCYIPTARLIKEGGYEADSSHIYYGFYGPFHPGIEAQIVQQVSALVDRLRR